MMKLIARHPRRFGEMGISLLKPHRTADQRARDRRAGIGTAVRLYFGHLQTQYLPSRIGFLIVGDAKV